MLKGCRTRSLLYEGHGLGPASGHALPHSVRYFGLIPAAGTGQRMGADRGPKQYLPIGPKTMLEHALDALLAEPRIERVFVVVAPDDARWRTLSVDPRRVEWLAVGGASRAETVRNGLDAIASLCGADDRVLVHDAARPCVAAADVARLIDEAGVGDDGGLLAIPVTDTLKRGADGAVLGTLDRAALWRAQTPQLFCVGSLRAALASGALAELTDEASAMERAGHAPRLVNGSSGNLKVTLPEDLVLAAAVLRAQGRL
jgi:2-C-methyl-D-erythritol 4-phosphate cytidylyltransferase